MHHPLQRETSLLALFMALLTIAESRKYIPTNETIALDKPYNTQPHIDILKQGMEQTAIITNIKTTQAGVAQKHSAAIASLPKEQAPIFKIAPKPKRRIIKKEPEQTWVLNQTIEQTATYNEEHVTKPNPNKTVVIKEKEMVYTNPLEILEQVPAKKIVNFLPLPPKTPSKAPVENDYGEEERRKGLDPFDLKEQNPYYPPPPQLTRQEIRTFLPRQMNATAWMKGYPMPLTKKEIDAIIDDPDTTAAVRIALRKLVPLEEQAGLDDTKKPGATKKFFSRVTRAASWEYVGKMFPKWDKATIIRHAPKNATAMQNALEFYDTLVKWLVYYPTQILRSIKAPFQQSPRSLFSSMQHITLPRLFNVVHRGDTVVFRIPEMSGDTCRTYRAKQLNAKGDCMTHLPPLQKDQDASPWMQWQNVKVPTYKETFLGTSVRYSYRACERACMKSVGCYIGVTRPMYNALTGEYYDDRVQCDLFGAMLKELLFDEFDQIKYNPDIPERAFKALPASALFVSVLKKGRKESFLGQNETIPIVEEIMPIENQTMHIHI